MENIIYLNSKNVETVLQNELKRICINLNIYINEVIDIDPIYRISTIETSECRLVRFYHTYGIFVIYKYNKLPSINPDTFTLLDFKVCRINTSAELTHAVGFETYFRSLLLLVIPSFFNKYSMSEYRILFVNAHPPFVDESYHTIGIDTNVIRDYEHVIGNASIGFFVLDIKGEVYICKIQNDKKSPYAALNRFGACNMLITYWNVESVVIVAMTKQNFMSKKQKWQLLEEHIGVVPKKQSGVRITNIKTCKLDEIGLCGNLQSVNIRED